MAGWSGQQEASQEDGGGGKLWELSSSLASCGGCFPLLWVAEVRAMMAVVSGRQRHQNAPPLSPPCPDNIWDDFRGPGGLGVCWELGCLTTPAAAVSEVMVAAPDGEGDGSGSQSSRVEGASWTFPCLSHLDWSSDLGICGLGEAGG